MTLEDFDIGDIVHLKYDYFVEDISILKDNPFEILGLVDDDKGGKHIFLLDQKGSTNLRVPVEYVDVLVMIKKNLQKEFEF